MPGIDYQQGDLKQRGNLTISVVRLRVPRGLGIKLAESL